MTEKKYLTLKQAQAVADDLAAVEEAVKERGPAAEWAGRCHEMSLAVLRTGLFGPGRVARGGAQGIMSQHSWITLGDPYDRRSVVVDPTYIPATTGEAGILVTVNMRRHWPQGGAGDIWADSGPPPAPTGKVVELEGFDELSPAARRFLEACGYPLDYRGWSHLVHGPVRGWPAGEIITAMCATRDLKVVTPIDIVGMTTELNPNGLYW